MGKAKRSEKSDERIRRREWVAKLRARHMTFHAIADALAKLEDPIEVSYMTVKRDCDVLIEHYKEEAKKATAEWIARDLADMDRLEEAAWAAKKYDTVMAIKAYRAKLLGMEKPVETKTTGEVRLKVVYGNRRRTDDPVT